MTYRHLFSPQGLNCVCVCAMVRETPRKLIPCRVYLSCYIEKKKREAERERDRDIFLFFLMTDINTDTLSLTIIVELTLRIYNRVSVMNNC